MAGNQLGKTLAGGFEVAMHMTGRYPSWWRGKRFDRPVTGWVCGRTGEDLRGGMQRFLLELSPDRSVTQMTIDDVAHYSDEAKARIVASYPPHEREARLKGVPVLGSGRIFPVPEEEIACAERDFPNGFPGHWPRIGGMDFGYDHPFAAVEVVWDRGSGT